MSLFGKIPAKPRRVVTAAAGGLLAAGCAGLLGSLLKRRIEDSRHQLEVVLEGVADGVTAQDSTGRLVYANEAAARIIGYPSARALVESPLQEVLGKFEVMDERGRPVPPERLPGRRALQGEGSPDMLLRFRVLATGEERWSIVKARPILDERGRVRLAINIFRDVTESRRTEEELRRREERFRLLVQNSSDVVTVFDAGGTILYESPSMERVLGYRPEERIGKNVFQHSLVHPDEAASRKDVLEKVFAETGAEVREEFRVRHANGSWRYVEVIFKNLLHEPSVGGIVANYRDITERKQAEEERVRLFARERAARLEAQEAQRRKEESLALLDTILEKAPVGFAFLDRDLRFRRVNDSLAAMDNIPAEQHLGRTLQEALPELEQRMGPFFRRVLETGEPIVDLEISGEPSAEPGRLRHWLVSYYPVRTKDGQALGVGCVVIDITDRKKAEEELARALRAKTDFLADVSHELRTPLTMVRVNAEAGLQIERDCAHIKLLEQIAEGSTLMTRLVEDLLFLARSETDSPPLKPEPVAAASFLAAVAKRAEALVRERGAILEAVLSGEGQLRIDPARIEQAVLILMDNAAKYGPPGGRVTLKSATGDGDLCISVEDRGPGIPEVDLPRIFERFYRSGAARANNCSQGGTGLGLAIAKTIVEGHGGRIEVASRVSQGTRVALYLPIFSPRHPVDQQSENRPNSTRPA